MSNQHIKTATETNRAVDAVTRLIETAVLPATEGNWSTVTDWADAYRLFAIELLHDSAAYWSMVALQAAVIQLEAAGIDPADVSVSGPADMVTTVEAIATFQEYGKHIVAVLFERAGAHADPFGPF